MTQQLELINNDKEKNWFSDLESNFGISEVSGWPDMVSKKLRSWSKLKKISINTLSLFSGGGGLDLGFHDVGFRVVDMVEIDKDYVKTLQENSVNWFDNTSAKCIDIREYTPLDTNIDFIIGGPPCQTFSSAGRRAKGVMGIDDPRGNLFKEYVRILGIVRPKAFLFENVYGLLGAQKGKPWQLIVEGFQTAGYKVFYKLVDAADYGVPQHRERVFIVGIRNDLNITFKFPCPSHGPDSLKKIPYYGASHAVKTAPNESPKLVNGKYGHLLDNIPPGLNYSFYTQKMGYPNPVFGWRSKFSDFLYKADPEKPVRAIKAQGGQYTGPFSWESRFFHTSELKRLQTFPDSYKIVGSRNIVVEQIGNSVPPQLARIMALAVLDQIFGVMPPSPISYMSDTYQLGFRNRKKELTKEYEVKAREAISKLGKSNNKLTNHFDALSEEIEKRFLVIKKMKWSRKAIQGAESYLIQQRYIEDKVWRISVNEINDFENEITYKIIVMPRNGWKLPFNRVELVSYSSKIESFTALWKSFEENISTRYGYADLVQLFGYYQYTSNIQTETHLGGFGEENLRNLLNTILNNEITNNTLTIDELSLLTRTSRDGVLSGLLKAKELGYEIRNCLTNPQIEEDHFLIPYIFPTLNDRSVQLSKSLI